MWAFLVITIGSLWIGPFWSNWKVGLFGPGLFWFWAFFDPIPSKSTYPWIESRPFCTFPPTHVYTNSLGRIGVKSKWLKIFYQGNSLIEKN